VRRQRHQARRIIAFAPRIRDEALGIGQPVLDYACVDRSEGRIAGLQVRWQRLGVPRRDERFEFLAGDE